LCNDIIVDISIKNVFIIVIDTYLTGNNFHKKPNSKTIVFSPIVILSFLLAGAIAIGATIMPYEMVNGQNATGQNATGQMENASVILLITD